MSGVWGREKPRQAFPPQNLWLELDADIKFVEMDSSVLCPPETLY